jgi:hypothetical protein
MNAASQMVRLDDIEHVRKHIVVIRVHDRRSRT